MESLLKKTMQYRRYLKESVDGGKIQNVTPDKLTDILGRLAKKNIAIKDLPDYMYAINDGLKLEVDYNELLKAIETCVNADELNAWVYHNSDKEKYNQLYPDDYEYAVNEDLESGVEYEISYCEQEEDGLGFPEIKRFSAPNDKEALIKAQALLNKNEVKDSEKVRELRNKSVKEINTSFEDSIIYYIKNLTTKEIIYQSNLLDNDDYNELDEKLNPLKDAAKKAKRKSKGLGAFVKLNAGNVEKGNAMFNKACGNGSECSQGEGMTEAKQIEMDTLDKAYNGSYYTITGAGGDLTQWEEAIQNLLNKENIGQVKEFITFKGQDMNDKYHLKGTVAYPNDLTFLAFPLDGLDVGKLAMFKLKMGDRWFDDIVDNNKAHMGEGMKTKSNNLKQLNEVAPIVGAIASAVGGALINKAVDKMFEDAIDEDSLPATVEVEIEELELDTYELDDEYEVKERINEYLSDVYDYSVRDYNYSIKDDKIIITDINWKTPITLKDCIEYCNGDKEAGNIIYDWFEMEDALYDDPDEVLDRWNIIELLDACTNKRKRDIVAKACNIDMYDDEEDEDGDLDENLNEKWEKKINKELAFKLRDAIENEDKEVLVQAFKEVVEYIGQQYPELVEDDYEYSSLLDDAEMLGAEDDDDQFDYVLSNLYDFLDSNDIWLPIRSLDENKKLTESLESKEQKTNKIIDIRKELNEMDKYLDQPYLLNLYDACKLTNEDKKELVEMIVSKEGEQKIGKYLNRKYKK